MIGLILARFEIIADIILIGIIIYKKIINENRPE